MPTTKDKQCEIYDRIIGRGFDWKKTVVQKQTKQYEISADTLSCSVVYNDILSLLTVQRVLPSEKCNTLID